MSVDYSLQFSNRTFPFDKKIEVYHSKINDNVASKYFIFLDGKLYEYTYDNFNLDRNLLNTTVDNQVLYFPKKLEDKKSLLLMKTNNGIDFYRYEDGKFNILLKSNEYSSSDWQIDWNEPEYIIKCGHFYSDQNLIGILSKNNIIGLQFHAVMEDELNLGGIPIFSLNEKNLAVLENVSLSKAQFFLADLKGKGKESIIIRNRNGLNFYEFDDQNELRYLLQVPESSKNNDFKEGVFFPDLTGQPLKNIVLFNTSGLFVYQYNIKQDNYQIIHYNPLFDEQRGWNKNYIDTIRFEDVNFDGKQDMFFTGPQGMDILNFDNHTLEWKSLLDLSRVAIPGRHSSIVDIVPSSSINKQYPGIFTQHQHQIYWAGITREQLEDNDSEDELPEISSTENITTPSIIPKLVKSKITNDDKSTILIRDLLDCSSIINGVDKNTGKANFRLPLIGLPNFSKDEKINLHYNGNNKDSSILGTGWSFPVNAIMLDYQGSIFPEDEKYFLLVENFPQSLTINSANSTDNVYNFILSDQESKTRIHYFKEKERWEIDYQGIKQVYGRREDSNEDSISYDLAWEYWRGAGSSSSSQVEFATTWFLSEIRSGQTNAIYYSYDIKNTLIPESGKKFTREVYLKAVRDNEGNEILFYYEDKNPEEFNVPPLMDADDNYNMKKVQTRYLAGYSISTYNYHQYIGFHYNLNNGNRLLTEIVQRNDPTNRPILQFSYKTIEDSYELERVALPTDASVEFSYKVIGGTDESNILEKIDMSCDVRNSYKVNDGHDFVLVSYIDIYKHVVLKMFNKELTKEMYSSISKSESRRFPFLGNKSVGYYEIKILEKSIAIILNYGDDKDVCLISKEKDKWSLNPKYYNYNQETIIEIGNDFIVAFDVTKNDLEVIVQDGKSKDWIKKKIDEKLIRNSTNSLLRVSNKVFFIYDDNAVTVGHRNENNNWQLKSIINLPEVISTMQKTLNKFNVVPEEHKIIMQHLKNNAFQISKNLLLFHYWNIDDTKLYSEIQLYTLNSKYSVSHQENYKVFQDDLTEISMEHEVTSNDGIKLDYILKYEKVGDGFKVVLKTFKETSQEQINKHCQGDAKCASQFKTEIEKFINDSYMAHFILNLNKYFAYLQSSIVSCGNRKFFFIGDKWKEVSVTESKSKSEKWSVFIDEKFVLEKEDSESSIKLYQLNKNKKEKKILDLEVKNINKIFNRYPKYLVYQTKNEDVKVVFYELLDNGIAKKFVLPPGETLSLMSSYNTLITHDPSYSDPGDNESLTLNFRQILNIQSNLPNSVIKKLTVNFDSDYKRISGYDYDPSSVKVIDNILYYEKIYMIPGDDKFSHGLIEESKNITDTMNIIKRIYDNQGNLIKNVRKEQSNKVKDQSIGEETESINSVLFDVTGHLEVAQFYPYDMQDDEVGYYGFENYEVNRIGAVNSMNRWVFDENGIIKQEFSLTGENYLRLINNHLLGTFQPRNQNQNYVASCWIRMQEPGLKIGTIAPFLKAIVYAADNREINGYFSKVKFQYDDWNYLEVVIDLPYSKQVFQNLLIKTTSVPNEKPFKIVIAVSPALNNTLDVDHIRLSPLNSDFQATIYNFKSREIKEVINSNGLVKRYLQNDYQDQIVEINENGEIGKLHSYTKSSSTDSIVKLKSKIQIQPNDGFYEDFNPHSFIKRWKVDNDLSWTIAPSEIRHITNQFDQLTLRNTGKTFDSCGLRLQYYLQTESSAIRFNDLLEMHREGNRATVDLSKKVQRVIPVQGELLIVVEQNRLMVWIDGGLYFDEGGLNKLSFNIQMYGAVKIRDVIVFFEPSVHVTYFNALSEKVQEISLESANSAVVVEFLYDELGRQCITTKSTRLQRSDDQPVVAYYSNFITNKIPLSDNSVWKYGGIQGEFEILQPYDYYQVAYSKNPLNENSAVGLPGLDFSIWGKFAKQFSSTTDNEFIKQCYPVDQGYRYHIELKLGEIKDMKVFDKRNNTVAMLYSPPGEKYLLATYEYNDDGKLIQILSPLYHYKRGIYSGTESQLQCLFKTNNEQENSLSVTHSYDKMRNIISKTTPDSGKVEYLYNDDGEVKFNIFYSTFDSTTIENVIYFDYDDLGRLTSTGKVISPSAKEKLLNLPLSKNNTEEYQFFYHSDFETEPTLRGKLKRSITRNNGIPLIEELLLNEDKSLSSKRIIVLDEDSNDHLIIVLNKQYRAGKLTEIEYPVDVQGKPLKVTYSYDKLGRIEGIGLLEKKNLFVKYTYNSNGLIESEHHLPDKVDFNINRKYSYNSASYLTRLEDKFLTENIYYTQGGYGDRGCADGTVTRTEFEATWHQYADSEKITLNEQSFVSEFIASAESKYCFNKLKSAGYIDQNNHQARIYYPFLEVDFPRICSEGSRGRQIQSVLGKQGFPSKYGHLYDYGLYQELTKAKYFVGEGLPAPLEPETFAKTIAAVSSRTSRNIWKLLNSKNYIIADKVITNTTLIDDPYFKPHAKRGRSIIRSTLAGDLKDIGNYRHYRLQLEKALTSYFFKKQDSLSFKLNLIKSFSDWPPRVTDSKQIRDKVEKDTDKIINMLENKGYLQNPLDKNFSDLLEEYQSLIPAIVEVLYDYLSKELGEAEFDLEAYKIDENGNHKHFYNGFERYKIYYRNNSNQIERINLISYVFPKSQIDFSMKHDSRGNVIQALHKRIKNITYHPVSNRATNIELEDGKTVIFHYDVQGERILKRVSDSSGAVIKEVHYVRDEFGRSLVEREMRWSSPSLPPSVLVTVFIYGLKGLVGFIRHDEYYSVITDHEGSIRLVVKNGEVVAAYDYLPYGNLMRQYASHSEAHISYRYTGQEWDEETDLYNYHARFYDPSIGRFYQHDPKMQYFSPYKYADNSPVSMIDPNGELAVLAIVGIMIALGLVGGYFGGAAVSNSWNPAEWNYKDSKLYAGIVFGGIGGALTPIMLPSTIAAFTALGFSYTASVALTLGIGTMGAYAGMARSASEWNPAKWDFSSPELWNGAFTGFITFTGAPGGIYNGITVFRTLPTALSKGAFMTGVAISGGTLIGIRLSSRTYDFSKPDAYYDILESVVFAADIPLAAMGGYRFFKTNIAHIAEGIKIRKLMRRGYTNLNDAQQFRSMYWRATTKFLAGITIPILAGVFVSAAYNEDGFDFNEPTTYEAFVNGAMMISSLGSHAYSSYKKRGLIRKQKVSEQLKRLAQKSVDAYLDIIRSDQFPKEIYKAPRIRDQLDAQKIPNRVLSVVQMKDNVVFVAYSGLNGPGFLSSFHFEGESHQGVNQNRYIGYKENPKTFDVQVALNDDPTMNGIIMESLKSKNQILKEWSSITYSEEKRTLNSILTESILTVDPSLNTFHFNNHEITNILGEIEHTIQDTGYLSDKDTMLNIIANPITREIEKIKKVFLTDLTKKLRKVHERQRNRFEILTEIEHEIVNLEEIKGFRSEAIDRNQDFTTMKGLLNDRLDRIKTHQSELITDLNRLKDAKQQDKNVWTQVYDNHFKKYADEFTHWEPINCAEPHVISLLMRSSQIFPAHVRAKYTLNDIKYLAAYKILQTTEITELKTMKRCANCQETTRTVTNVISDPEWLAMIDDESKKLKNIPKNRFFFPFYKNITVHIPHIPNITEENVREKRSAIDYYNNSQGFLVSATNGGKNNLENDQNNSDYAKNNKSINNVREEKKKCASNLFGWIGTSFNRLFELKKLLPEKLSTSNMFKGITDAKNNSLQATAIIDVNSTLLLLDTLLRKATGKKHISVAADHNTSLIEARGYSLDVGLAFEKTIKYAASKSGISMHRFNIHYLDIQDKVIDKILRGRLDEIAEILISHAEKACPFRENGCPGKLSPKKFNKFLKEFSKRIDTELNEIMQRNKSINNYSIP